MQQLIVATRNVHKSNEFQRILGPDFAVYDLSEHPEIPETVERGKTFEENAVLKATGASKELSGLIIADDSGLEVDALGGAPGIYSARYASQNASDRQNIDKLLSELARTSARQEQRSARFRCVLALAESGRILEVFEGVVAGTIIELPRGRNGFGYDPIFLPKGLDQTFGELAAAEKDRLSHRALALEELRAFLDTMPGQQKGNRDSYHWLGYRV